MTTNAAKIVAAPRLLFRPDPVTGWSLTPDRRVKVRFRKDVSQTVGPDGWRHIPPAASRTGPRIAIYGCSFTYGTGLADDETFTARLQADLPGVQIKNRGIGGHGTVQNLLQFRRDIANAAVDGAVFALISDHKFRNIAHPQRMRQYLDRAWYMLGVEHVPVVRLDATGRARIVYRAIWQPVIRDAEFDIFLPDDYMMNAATLAVLDLVVETAAAAGVPLRLVLLDALDPGFTAAVQGRFGTVPDISTPYDKNHTFLPQDLHPNVMANGLFAERLHPVISDMCRETAGGAA